MANAVQRVKDRLAAAENAFPGDWARNRESQY